MKTIKLALLVTSLIISGAAYADSGSDGSRLFNFAKQKINALFSDKDKISLLVIERLCEEEKEPIYCVGKYSYDITEANSSGEHLIVQGMMKKEDETTVESKAQLTKVFDEYTVTGICYSIPGVDFMIPIYTSKPTQPDEDGLPATCPF